MSDYPPRPSAWLLECHARFSKRYMSPGVQLTGFDARWTAFRAAELRQGVEHAVLDVDGDELDAEGEDLLLARAQKIAGADSALVTVELSVSEWTPRPGRAGSSASARPVLWIAVKVTNEPSGVMGFVELDNESRPTGRISRPLPLMSLGPGPD